MILFAFQSLSQSETLRNCFGFNLFRNFNIFCHTFGAARKIQPLKTSKMFKIWFLAAFAVIIVASHPPREQNEHFRLYRGQIRFAVSMIKSLRKYNPQSNIFCSPHSVYRILLRAYIGTGGAIKQSLSDVLFLDWAKDENDIADAYVNEKLARSKRFLGERIHFNSVDKFYITRKAMLM